MNDALHTQINVAPRSFNRIEVDEVRGVLTKTSRHKDKLRAEICWYLKIPKKLQCFAPRIFDYSLDNDSTFVKMEFYGYRTLHELLLNDAVGGGDIVQKNSSTPSECCRRISSLPNRMYRSRRSSRRQSHVCG